jgi:hypothetical protein
MAIIVALASRCLPGLCHLVFLRQKFFMLLLYLIGHAWLLILLHGPVDSISNTK